MVYRRSYAGLGHPSLVGSTVLLVLAVLLLSSIPIAPGTFERKTTRYDPLVLAESSFPPLSNLVGGTIRTTSSAVLEAVSGTSAGSLSRTIFPNLNAVLFENFPWSVLGWQVGTPAFVPSTGDLWLPMRAVSTGGLPVPQFSPAVVYNVNANEIVGVVPSIENSSAFIYDPSNHDLYTAEYQNNSVGVINSTTGGWVHSSIPVGSQPVALALDSQTNQLYVANFGSNNVTVVNAGTNAVGVSGIPTGPSPGSLSIDLNERTLFVTDTGDRFVRTIDTSDNSTGPSISLPGVPSGVSFSSLSDQIIVTIPSYDSATLVDASTLGIVGFPVVGTGAGPVVTNANGTEFIVGNETGSNLVVLNSSSGAKVGPGITVGPNVTALSEEIPGSKLFAWGSVTHEVYEIDLPSENLVQTSPTLAPEPGSVAYDPITKKLFVADTFGGTVVQLSGSTGDSTGSPLSLGSTPLSLALDQATHVLYVGLSEGIDAVNPSTGAVLASNSALVDGNSPIVIDLADSLLWVANGASGLEALSLSTLNHRFTVGIPAGFVSQETMALDTKTGELFVINSTSGDVEAVNASTGHVDTAAIAAGADPKAIAYDSTDDSIYVAGADLTIIDPSTRVQVGAAIPLPSHAITTGIAFDPSRSDLYITTDLAGPVFAGSVTVVDGSTRSASYGSQVSIPVGEFATAPTPVFLSGGSSPAATVVWVPNLQSGTLSEIASPPQITYLAANPSTVDVGQTASILLSYTGGAAPDSIKYYGLPTGCLTANTTSLVCSPVAPGMYVISANVTDSLGEYANTTTTLNVSGGLSLDLVLTPGPSPVLDLGENLTGVATASGGTPTYAYTWSLGDGAYAPGPDVIHQYGTPGTYLLSVSVTDSVRDTVTESRLVVVNLPPTAAITVSPTNATDVGAALRFSATVTGGTGTGVGTWNFTGSQAQVVAPVDGIYSVSHSWSESGTDTAVFSYVDANNVSVQRSVSVMIEPSLTATFSENNSVRDSSPVVGSSIDFAAVVHGGLEPYNVTWSFDDGSYGYGDSTTHTFATAGTYAVEAVLTDAAGSRLNATLPVVVGAAPTTTVTTGSNSTPSFGVSLFVGLLAGGAVAAVGMYAIGRSKRRNPPPPHPYVPPDNRS
jgi:YVTN family beta-propeller protein